MIWLAECLRGKPGEAARTSVWSLVKCPGQRLKLTSSLDHHTGWLWASDIPSLGFSYKIKQNDKQANPMFLYLLNMRAHLLLLKSVPASHMALVALSTMSWFRKHIMNSEMFSDEFVLCYSSVNVCVHVTLVLITNTSINTWKICVRNIYLIGLSQWP